MSDKNKLGWISHAYDQAPWFMMLCDGEGVLVDCNPAVKRHIRNGRGDHDDTELRLGALLSCHQTTENQACAINGECADCVPMTLVRKSLDGSAASGLCSYPRSSEHEGCLEIHTVPVDIDGQRLCGMWMLDVTEREQRLQYEAAFLHDLLNETAALHGLVQWLLEDGSVHIPKALKSLLHAQVERLHLAVREQKDLFLAEKQMTEPRRDSFDLNAFLDTIQSWFQFDPRRGNREVRVRSVDIEGIYIITDRDLLVRLLQNMVINALEATPALGIVELTVAKQSGVVRFAVQNEGVIAEEVRPHLFQPLSSQKGDHRGLGTYSMRIIGENQLGGTVGFESSPQKGTVFWFDLPQSAHDATVRDQ